MRVLQIMECTIGGTRRHLRDLVLGLRARGVGVEVACAALREPAMRRDMERFEAAGVRVHEIPMVRAITPATDVVHAWRLARVIADRRFDVVHTHSSKAGALGRAVAVGLSSAVRVHTPHTFAAAFEGKGQGGEDIGNRSLVLATERLLGRVTSAMVHVSEAERAEGQQLGVIRADRARVVHNGIDPSVFAGGDGAAFRREHGIPDGVPLVGTVGLLNDAKGHDLLIDAVARLPDDVHLALVGHGELEDALRAQAEACGLAPRLRITGWVDGIADAYAAMDVFALSSRWEGLSYALLEAMAAGRACVSTEVNGSPEVLHGRGSGDGPGDEAGLIVPRGDPVAMADALGALLADPERRAAMGRAARDRVSTSFTVDAMVDRTVALYRALLGAPQVAPAAGETPPS